MKKIIILSICYLLTANCYPALAATSTPSSKTQDLLSRVATKVASLATKLKRGYFGTVKSVSDKTIIVTIDNTDKTVTVDQDLTTAYKYKSGVRSELSLKNIKNGDDVSIIGTIDPTTSEIAGRQIIVKTKRQALAGKLSDLGKIDLKTAAWVKKIDAAGKIISGKISEIKPDTQVFVVAYSTDSGLSALKIIYKL
jgi:predicted aconitase with swiveling domain